MCKSLTAYRYLYGLFLIGIAVLLIRQVSSSHWLQTDLHALLPTESAWSIEQRNADQMLETQFNQQMIALIGHSDMTTAFTIAEQIGQQWQVSGLFQQVDYKIQPNIAQLQQQVEQLKIAVLPEAVRHQLLTQPQAYFQQYAKQISHPFDHPILPLTQDWLGFGRFVLPQSQQLSQLHWNATNGMFYVQTPEKTWVFMQGRLVESQFADLQQTLLDVMEQGHAQVVKQGGEWLVTGAALFASIAKQQAESESKIMSLLGIGLTLCLLLGVFRTFRIFWLFLPIFVGMLTGIVATIIFFGQIHIFTLVIGTSLIGVLIDFPLHWLAASLFHFSDWKAENAMKTLRFTFLISLGVTLLGYGLLGFTPLPVLQQTALFSSVALVFALCTTMLYLPPIFHQYIPHKRLNWTKYLSLLSVSPFSSITQKIVGCVFACFVIVGIYRSQWQDDIRQWVALPSAMLSQANQIANITGISLSSQYFLITAENDEQLLEKDKKLVDRLLVLQQQGKVGSVQALSQWIRSETAQRQLLAEVYHGLIASDYSAFQEIGVPIENMVAEQKNLVNRPLVSLTQALDTEVGQMWKTFYLGKLVPDRVASVVKVSDIEETRVMEQLAGDGIYWQDKRQHLNRLFEHTRNQAGYLKLLSFVLAWGGLWWIFGFKQGSRMILIPLTAVAVTLGILGWLNIGINLFAMFGLLLVSAIGIDYVAYMQTAKESIFVKRTAVLLAATTTLISFLLLGLSNTPAIAVFGLTVSLGVLGSVLIAFSIFKSHKLN